MTNLDKDDIKYMYFDNDHTPLRLHWEGATSEPSLEIARSIIHQVNQQIAKGCLEEDVWKEAYIFTDEDYQKYKRDNDHDEENKKDSQESI